MKYRFWFTLYLGYYSSNIMSSVGKTSKYTKGQDHRNNRHRMRAPIFSQSKICLHKMAHSKGHFYSVQTPVARNFARLRGVRLFFSNTVFLKSLKTRLN